jgi:ribonuclease R
MILANRVVAKEYFEKEAPFVYRVHQAPLKEKVENVRLFMKGLGIETPAVPSLITSEYYQALSKKVEGKDVYETVSKVLLRSMQKARYAPENLGHFGLALENYCHFTSPIRRYPDLTIHRFIKAQLHKELSESEKEDLFEFAEESSLQSSEMERNAEKAERDVDDLWKAYLMKDHIGEEFDGIITSVLNFGFFVELDNSVEGLVRIECLPADNYFFMEKSLQLKGGVHSYKIGDKVRVKLVSSNIYTRKIDFELA